MEDARPTPVGPDPDPESTGPERPSNPLIGWLAAAIPAMAVVAVAAMMVAEKLRQGPNYGWDTYAFVCNAMEMAGRSVGYIEPGRPPFLSFLTSLFVRAGVWNDSSILFVDVALGAVGVVALYFLLARRFPRWIAAAGSALLVGMPPFWATIGTGMTDFASVALSICAVLFTVKATEDDPRWYLAAFPFWVAASLTRFGALILVVPMVVWLILRARPFRDAKYLAAGAVTALLVYLPAGLWFSRVVRDFTYPLQMIGRVSEGDFAVGGQIAKGAGAAAKARVIPGQWYLENIQALVYPKSVGILATVLLIAAGVGLLVATASALYRARARGRWLVPVAAASVVLATQSSNSTALRILTIVALGLSVAWSTRPRAAGGEVVPERADDVRWALDALMLTWGLLYFDAHGHMAFQLDRYFLTMAPALLYFTLIGWRELGRLVVRYVSVNARRRDWAEAPLVAVWTDGLAAIALALVAAAVVYPTFRGPQPVRDPWRPEVENAAAWMKSHVPDIRDKTVLSDAWPYASYYLGQNVQAMQLFPDKRALPWELEKRRADYYVSMQNNTVPGYKQVYKYGKTSVWQRQAPFSTTTPKVAYLGRGWDTYLEIVTDYDFQLMFGLRLALVEDDWGLDRFSVEELQKYDAVAIYGATWQDRAKAERTLTEYVNRGGVVVIDASHNMSDFRSTLSDSVFLGMLIRRSGVLARGTITLEGGLTRASGSTSPVEAAPFIDEAGGPWYGAVYTPLDPKMRLQVLARLNGRPVVLVQRIGRGRVYWIGSNLMWHAFLNEDNPESNLRRPGSPETDLMRGVMRAVLDLPPLSQTATTGTLPTP